MKQVLIFALSFTLGFALDQPYNKVYVIKNKFEVDKSDDYLHKIERRAVSSSRPYIIITSTMPH